MDRSEVYARFQKDTAEHAMTVLRDDGLYRHLRFQKPGTWCYGFDIVTWPGYLAITGDMGASLFARTADMIEFFRPERGAEPSDELFINPPYWSEKLQANGGETREFREDLFRATIKEHFDDFVSSHQADGAERPAWAADLWRELEDQVISEAVEYRSMTLALKAMQDFQPEKGSPYERYTFEDVGEYASSLQGYTFHFTWRLYAIAHAVQVYDAAKAQAVPA